jgi:hypothetical protein
MKKFILTTLVLTFVFSLDLSAQVTTGTILGMVKDPSGAVIPGVQIVITESSKGISKTFVTGDTGAFTAPFLIPGTYDISAEITGFKKQVQTGVVLQVDQKARVDFTLEIGATSETVTVEAAAPLVKATSSELGEVIEGRAVRELPLNGRNFAQLVYLSPGITPGNKEKTSPAPAPSIREALPTSMPSAVKPTAMPGWSTASTTTNTLLTR